ncbi:MAG: glycosyltransferase [Kiritimatiellae bacterium]|jgi:glycosyltransferase involved in cell wall biosynthesis|nr:glycosyltransferase [Kiritimatiellia bacterium]
MNPIGDVSVILPTINEVQALDDTLRILLSENRDSLKEILVIVCDRTAPESLDTARGYVKACPEYVRILPQEQPFLGGALLMGIRNATGGRILTMFSDLESDPHLVKTLIDVSNTTPGALVQASRWIRGSAFEGYGRPKLVCNAIAQWGLRMVYPGNATDFTFGFRLYPGDLLRSLTFTECRHGFVLESLLLALRLKIPVEEVPCTWRKRSESTSMISWKTYLHYLPLSLRVRFRPRHLMQTGYREGCVPL